MTDKPTDVVGRAEKVDFPEIGVYNVPAKIDTGAKTSAIWASGVELANDGQLSFLLFDQMSPHYTGQKIRTEDFDKTIVTSSMGMREKRYVVKLAVKLKGRKIRASFTLADRSKQIYPILIGRNILRGKFIVDVKKGQPLKEREEAYYEAVEKAIENESELEDRL